MHYVTVKLKTTHVIHFCARAETPPNVNVIGFREPLTGYTNLPVGRTLLMEYSPTVEKFHFGGGFVVKKCIGAYDIWQKALGKINVVWSTVFLVGFRFTCPYCHHQYFVLASDYQIASRTPYFILLSRSLSPYPFHRSFVAFNRIMCLGFRRLLVWMCRRDTSINLACSKLRSKYSLGLHKSHKKLWSGNIKVK